MTVRCDGNGFEIRERNQKESASFFTYVLVARGHGRQVRALVLPAGARVIIHNFSWSRNGDSKRCNECGHNSKMASPNHLPPLIEHER